MRNFYLFVSALFFFLNGFSQTQSVTFDNYGSQQWTVPCGVTSITVQAWGAGAGGSTSGGGGGGAFASKVISVTPGTTYTLYVGRGSTSSGGDAGEDSYFATNLVKAEGGGKAGIRTGGRASQSIGTIRHSGGDGGSSGTGRGGSGGGGSAGSSGDGGIGIQANGNGGANGGNGGNPNGGDGGNGGGRNSNGYTGSFPGGGGGERGTPNFLSSTSNGKGGNGQIIIYYESSLGIYCSPTISNVEPITNVTFATINNSTSPSGSDQIEFFCSPVGEVMQGTSYNLSVQGNTNDSYNWFFGWTRYTNYFTAFIDWNQNGDFEPGEITNIGTIQGSTGQDGKTANITISVPSTATLGLTKMRIIKNYNGYPTDPCVNYSYGQAEDYLINVSGNCKQPTGTLANDASANITVCAGTPVTLKQTGGTLGAGANWKWYSGSCGGTLLNSNNKTDASYTFTPTASGTYFVRAEGGNCGTSGICKSVTVTVTTPGTIILSTGTKDFSACLGTNNNSYATFTIGGGATGANVSGLPSGITGTVSGKVLTIKGNPSVSGTFNYIITLNGNTPCNNPEISGTIQVNLAPATLSYSNSTVIYCAGSSITANQPSYTGGTPNTYSVIGTLLPAGLALNTTTGVITGIPTIPTGAANYTIRASNSCGSKDAVINIRISDGNTPFNITPGGTLNYCGTAPATEMGLSGSESGVKYRLYLNGVASGAEVAGTGSAISFGTRTAAGTYTVKTTTGCISNMNGSTTITITPQPTITFKYPAYTFCRTGSTLPALTGIPQNGTFTATPAGLVIDETSGAVNLETSSPGTYTISYSVSASGACAIYTFTQPNKLVINAYPQIQEVFGGGSFCAGLDGLEVGLENSEIGVNYQLFRNGTAVSPAKIISGTGEDITFGNQTTAGTYTVKAYFASTPLCGIFMEGQSTIIVNQPPSPITINPKTKTICQGEIVPLTVSYSPPTTATDFVLFKSGDLDGEIPNNSSTGISHLLKVTGVPEGATVTSVVVKFKITHDYTGDLLINLKGPNGKVLNIANGIGGTGNDFNITTISSTATNNISTASAPFNNTYSPQGTIGVNGAQVVTANLSNVNSFADLLGSSESNGNGNWMISIRDKEEHGYYSGWLFPKWNPEATGYFNKWEITINYSFTSNPVGVNWSPAEDLFTDPGATIPYVQGTLLSKVYAKPSSSGLKTYTATALSATGCNAISTTNITVNTAPVIKVSADYCTYPGKIRITATSDIPVTNWKWSGNLGTGTVVGNTSYIEPNTAGTFYVTAKSAGNSCTGLGEMSIAQELVVNGDFEAGNTGFSSDYTYVSNTMQNGLVPNGGIYTVHNDPHYTHHNFWGADHTTADGYGNFMLVNGTSNKKVWKQTVTVIPNTTYYFSAYAVSLNDVSPFANLKFRVNNTDLGTPTGALPSKSSDNNPGNWQRFYGNWNSGSNTTATIEIVNLQNAEGGNDFGLDDISFGTLSTFFNLTSAPATENQSAICVGTEITEIAYEAGGDGNQPTISAGALPAGLTTFWNGRNFKINGTPTESGTFTFTLKSSGCNPKFKTVKIVVDPPAQAGTFENDVVSVCYNTNGTIKLNGIVGNITNWQRSEDDGITWNTVAGTSTSLTALNITKAVLYKATIKNKSCAAIETPTVKVGVRNLWTGEEDNNFTNIKNWSDETIPSVLAVTACPTVVIPAVVNLPVLSSGNPSITNLQINASASLKINGTGSLGIAGIITNNGILDVKDGTIEFNGTATQSLSGSILKDKTIRNLTVSNAAELKISPVANDTLNITGMLTFGKTNAKLNTGDNITLKSTATGTAGVGVVPNNSTITGKFVVERFINTGTTQNPGAHGKSWQLLATPTTGATIKESWQEGAISDGKLPMKNPTVGFGTLLTTGYSNIIENGFDVFTAPGPSIKTFNSKTNSYDKGPLSTSDLLYNPKGYLVLVRGDRTVYTSSAAATPTVLRSKGKIITGTTAPIAVDKDSWESIGNPYPSQLDLRKLIRTGGVGDVIFVWDPKLGGAYGLGAFQTLTFDGANYYATPGGGSYGSGANNYLQSGQAFLVQSFGSAGTVSFTESMKESGSQLVLRRGAGDSRKIGSIRTSLHGIANGIPFLTDGNLVQFSEEFSNEIDGMDARKMTNTSENLGIRSGGVDLVVERRKNITAADTIFFKMSGVRVQAYQIEIEAANLYAPGLEAWLEDSYLQNRTSLNLEGTTTINFTIANIPASYASDRFRIVFKPAAPAAPLPVTFLSINANRKNADVLVDWKVELEMNLKQYEVERSQNGVSFAKVTVVLMDRNNPGSYEWLDQEPAVGLNYYRIRSVDLDGKTSFSSIAKVMIDQPAGSISVYPNPVINGTLNLQLGNQPEGTYSMRLLNPVGQVLLTKKIEHNGGNYTEKINWDYKMARGMYQLEVTKPGGGVHLIKVVY